LSKSRDVSNHIIHLTPDLYRDYPTTRPRVGYFAWETSRLPPKWVKELNEVGLSEVWVPCEYLRKVCVESGVDVNCVTVPHVIQVPPNDFVPPCDLAELPEDKFKFYSIFQWSARKNPEGLLTAYYREFSRRDNVVLILKTYRRGTSSSERDQIRREISQLKRATKGIDCPPVLLIEEFLTDAEVNSLHYYGDCYVSMARNEGFGIPAFTAAAFGNPVIVPNYSAFEDHFHHENAYLVNVPCEVPVSNMQYISILYTGNMVWGDPSIDSCREQMRKVYENRKDAQGKGAAARAYVAKNLSPKRIGRMMKGRLETIHRGI